MESHWISFAALVISIATLTLNVVIYRNSKKKADTERIITMEAGLSKKITDLGDKVDKDVDGLRGELSEEVSGLRGRIGRNDNAIAHLKEAAEHAPTHSDLGTLHEKINGVKSDVSGIDGKLDGVNNLLRTIHEHLLRAAR